MMDVVTLGMAKAAMKGKVIDPNDVGYDIILVAGQSNAVGSGTAPAENKYLDPWHPRIFQWPGNGVNMGTIIAGIDPIFHYTGSASVGPAVPFAREYLKRVPNNRSVLLVPTGRGATSFTQAVDVGVSYSWDPANTTAQVNLYNFTVAQMDSAIAAAGPNSRVVAMLWLQGEGDVNYMTQSQYATKLDSLIDGLRTRYGASIPFIVGQMLPEGLISSTNLGINSAHIDTARRKTLTAFAYGPTGMYNNDTPPIHYSTPGQRALGLSFFDAFNRFAKVNVTGKAPATPGAVSLSQSGTTVNATWVRTPSRWTDYKVEYNINGAGWVQLTRAQSIELSAAITGVTLGATIQVRVSAINENGTSAPSAASSLTLLNLPPQVTGLTAGAATMYSQPLSWAAAATASKYLVEYKPTSGSTWTTATSAVTGTSWTVTGLSAATSYDFRVSAINAAGTGTASATATNSTLAFSALRSVVGVAPAVAYSLRQLDTAYAGKAINVRRSSDNTALDIGFTASGDLDTAALLTFAGSGSAYIATWYDQSGAAANVTNATQAQQPRIVNAGVLDTVNGRPSAVFSGGQYLTSNRTGSAIAGTTILAVADTNSYTAEQDIYAEHNAVTSAKYAPFAQFANTLVRSQVFVNDAAASLATGSPGAFTAGYTQLSFVDAGTTATTYQNGVSLGSATISASRGAATLDRTELGSRGGTTTSQNGHISEVVVYYTQPNAAQRQAGEANEKAYFGTP